MFIVLHGQSIEYELKRSSRSKRMRLAVYPGGRFVVSVPVRMNEKRIDRFLLEKSEWILSKVTAMQKVKPVEKMKLSKQELSRLKVVALEIAHRRCEYFNVYYQFTYKKISARNQKTRWGSCSRQGNLNFKQMNHSKKFWDLVAKTFPDHKVLRRELKKEHIRLS